MWSSVMGLKANDRLIDGGPLRWWCACCIFSASFRSFSSRYRLIVSSLLHLLHPCVISRRSRLSSRSSSPLSSGARCGCVALRRALHLPPHIVHSWKMFPHLIRHAHGRPRRSFTCPHAAVISSTHPSHPVTAHTPIHDISLPYLPLPFLLPFVIVLMSGCVWIVLFSHCNYLVLVFHP